MGVGGGAGRLKGRRSGNGMGRRREKGSGSVKGGRVTGEEGERVGEGLKGKRNG